MKELFDFSEIISTSKRVNELQISKNLSNVAEIISKERRKGEKNKNRYLLV